MIVAFTAFYFIISNTAVRIKNNNYCLIKVIHYRLEYSVICNDVRRNKTSASLLGEHETGMPFY